MQELEEFGLDEGEALGRLETLWSAYEKISAEAARYDGSLGWKTNAGLDYLVHTVNLRYEGNRQRTRSLGPRSEETERRMAEFREGRDRSRERLARVQERLEIHGRVLKVLRLGRLSSLTARFLRELHAEGFGAGHFRIGGGAALAAYGVRARIRMPTVGSEDEPDFDLLPTELFVRDQRLFDAVASRKIFGPVEPDGDRLVLGRGIVLRMLSEDVLGGWVRHMSRAGVGVDEINALRWAVEVPEAVPLLAVGRDGSPAPVAALDPRAFAVLAAVEARHVADDPTAARLAEQAAAVAGVAADIVSEPFERGHLALFPEIADAVGEGGLHAHDGIVMRP